MTKVLFVYILFSFVNILSLLGFHIDMDKPLDNLSLRDKMLIKSAGKFFTHTNFPLSSEFIATNPYHLLQAAQDTLQFICKNKEKTGYLVEPPHFSSCLSQQVIEKTLEFIITTIKQDMSTGKFRIFDPNFLNQNFKFIKWNGDRDSALLNGVKLPYGGNIRLTSYAIFSFYGNTKKTSQYPCALYRLLDRKICKKYSKQQILNGILNSPKNRNKVEPMVWLSRKDFEDALMQGTVVVRLPGGKERVFTVSWNNGIAYDKTKKNVLEQKRYWFFEELHSSRLKQFEKRQNVVFAGDIYNIGLGKIIALKHVNPLTQKKELRLGIIADTGGAFLPNLYQLDLFAGIFNRREDFVSYIKHLPVQTEAYILYRQ